MSTQPSSTLSKNELKNLFGDFTRDGVRYFINPDVLLITRNSDGSVTSQASRGFGQPAFPGQVFFNVAPGQVGNLERNFVNGPAVFNMDAGISKRIAFTENTSLQLRAEAFNLTNRNNFFLLQQQSISATNFGQLSPDRSQQALSLQEPRRLQFAIRFEF